MEKKVLLSAIYHRVSKLKWLVLLLAGLLAAIVFIYRWQRGDVFTSKATVYPLTSRADNLSVANTLTSLLGMNQMPTSYSQEATINIIELAESRHTRESVVMERIPQFGNKRIAELLVENFNSSQPFFLPEIPLLSDSAELAATGANLLFNGLEAKINKNGILEVKFSSNDHSLVQPISYKLVEKISEFYVDLKMKKAKADYEFIDKKVDSFRNVMGGLDRQSIGYSNTSLFVSPSRLEYQLPKENVVVDKQRVGRQYDAALNNREEALWRLQKATPVIEVLDKPDPPYGVSKPWSILYAMAALIIAFVLLMLMSVSDLVIRYLNAEVRALFLGSSASK